MATISDVNTIHYSGDLRADALLDQSVPNWNYLLPYRTALYYTFDCSPGSAIDQQTSEALTTFNATQKAAAASILSYASTVTGISFIETASGGSADFHFGAINISGATTSGLCLSSCGYSYTTGDVLTAYTAESYIYLDNVEFASSNNSPTSGSSSYETLLHEIGHALGLGHPFDGSLYQLPDAQDNTNNTVMSYTRAGANKTTFQSYDLLALTWIYGSDGLAGNYGYNSVNGSSLSGSSGSDTTAPTVTTFSPADEATSVAVGSNIVLTFSEAIARGTGNIILKTSAGSVVATYDAAASSNLTISGNTLTLNPSADLAAGTAYKVEFAVGSIKDLANNAYAGTTSYNFTTVAAADTTAPTVTTFSPADEASNAAVSSNIVITFSENITLGTGAITLKKADGGLIKTFSSSELSFSGKVLTINPSADLAPGTAYKVELAAGAVKDAAGNLSAAKTDYNFTTEASTIELRGTDGNDILTCGAGNDELDGRSGIDTAKYSGNFADYSLSKSASGFTVQAKQGADGTDTLINIERLQFADKKVAIDLDGNAGSVAKTLGAVFGVASLANKEYVGIGLNLLDGGMSYPNLVQFALNVRLGEGFSNAAEVALLYQSIAVTAPSAAEISFWTDKIVAGEFTQASLAIAAGKLQGNLDHINLVGLQQTGVEYTI